MRHFHFLVALLISTQALWSQTEGELKAMQLGLRNNPSMQMIRVVSRSDQLKLVEATSNRLPTLKAEIGSSVVPWDTAHSRRLATPNGGTPFYYLEGRNSSEQSLRGKTELSWPAPGGGTFSASAAKDLTNALDPDTLKRSTTIAASFSQPLLRNAWQHDPKRVDVEISRIDLRTSTLSQKKQILGFLSSVRRSYWDCSARFAALRVAEERIAFEQKQHAFTVRRFQLGQVPEIDTLTSALELLKAQRELNESKSLAELEQKRFSTLIGSDSIAFDDDLTELTVEFLPPADTILNRARSFDPGLEIIAATKEKLLLSHSVARNALLPDARFGIGYSRTFSGDAPLSSEIGLGENTVLSLILSYELPTRKRQIAIQKNRLEQDRADFDEQQSLNAIKIRVEEIVSQWAREVENISVLEKSLLISRRQLTAAEAGYRTGTIDNLTLIKAQNDYSTTALQLLRAKVNLKTIEIAFDEVTGMILSKFGLDIL